MSGIVRTIRGDIPAEEIGITYAHEHFVIDSPFVQSNMPEILLDNIVVPTAINPLGAKGVGEAGTVGSLAATMNAVCNALSPLGVTHLDMPASPQRVWQAIRDAGS